jgi:uncharacterized delta-60 repeat protein
MKKLITLTAIVLIAAIAGFAQMPAGIDSTFGNNGFAYTLVYNGSFELGNHIVASDGKILVAGHTAGANEDLYATKFNKNGTLDNAFGNAGKSQYDPKLGADDACYDVVELPDGKFLLAGSTDGANNRDIMLLRLNSDGTIDNTFQNNGLLEVNFQGDDVVEKIKVYNNKIYLGAWSKTNNNPTDAYIIRLNMDGTLDQSFGTFSFTTIDPKPGDKESMDDFIIMKDGSIVVIGNTTGQTQRQYICKLMPDGKFDTNFGINGYFFFSNGNSTGFNSLAEGPNGILYICGMVDVNSYTVATLWKVDANGIPSATFGSGNGKASLNLGAKSDQLFFDMEVLDNGDIFLVGVYRFDGGALQPVTAVFTDDGSFNTNYHGTGFDTLNMAPNYGTMYFENVTKDADGNMVVTGIAMDQAFDSYQVTARFKKHVPPSVSVKAIDATPECSVYPNPSAGTFSIKTDGSHDVKLVNMFDISGKQVAGWTNAQDSYTVPTHIPNGLYYISISFEDGVENRKLILNR